MKQAGTEVAMKRLRALFERAWKRSTQWSDRQHAHAAVLGLLIVAAAIHQLIFVYWYIEDAAISFSYARNVANGEGFVTYPGGERVEGFSNPLWTYLLVAFQLIGVDGFISSKIMGVFFGSLCLPLAYLLTEEAFGHGEGSASWSAQPSHYSLVAPAFLAGSAQFAIWNASGLENSLFCALLAAGMWRTVVETRTNSWPTAAFFFFALTITRPEGILYAAFGGFWAMVLSLQAHRSPALTIKWLVSFFGPFSAYQAVRYSYFAWPFPNTYYAKLGSKEFQPFAWNIRGWKYIRDWSHVLWHGYLIPVYLFGLVGRSRGARTTVAGVLCLLVALMLPGPDLVRNLWPWTAFRAPAGWNETRVWCLLLLAICLGLRTLGTQGWRSRALAYGMASLSLFFALWSGGDWMKGYRWMSLLTVPTAVLFAAGSRDVVPILGKLLTPLWVPLATGPRVLARRGRFTLDQIRAGTVTVGVLALLGCIAGPNLFHSNWFANKPETGPFSVQKRVNYINYVERRLHLLHRPTTFDVDMGANMYWSGNKIADVAGLVDVSMGHHNFEMPFMREYVFEEVRPEFVHSHGGWASRSRLQTHPQWREQYFEIPGYPTGRTALHIGNWVRRDLFTESSPWPSNTERTVAYEQGIVITTLDAPVPAAVGGHLYLEVGVELVTTDTLKLPRDQDWNLRLLAFITDGSRVQSWDLPYGYDWYRPHDARGGDVFRGRYSVKLPADLQPGAWQLGLVVMGPDGTLPAIQTMGEQVSMPERAVLATGEVRFDPPLQLLPAAEARKAALDTVQASVAAAEAGDCDTAEDLREQALRRMTRRTSFREAQDPAMRHALAGCHTATAEATEERVPRSEALIRARDWDHSHPDYRFLSRRHGERLYQDGHLARANGDWEQAFTLFSESVAVDPRRAWSRRFAEEARDFRLGIDPFTLAEQEAERKKQAEERRIASEKRRAEMEARRAEKSANGNDPEADPGEEAEEPETPASEAVPAGRPRRGPAGVMRRPELGRGVPLPAIDATRATDAPSAGEGDE